ncbi:hypothetical protein CCMA1212_008731 [Trichoderma ghanense]|uniref:Secreted protein n=1 Tax=Trichoderma ghanense TaxID=65468 RepID=A0ABY2GTV4_9HYPO
MPSFSSIWWRRNLSRAVVGRPLSAFLGWHRRDGFIPHGRQQPRLPALRPRCCEKEVSRAFCWTIAAWAAATQSQSQRSDYRETGREQQAVDRSYG